ncbi:polysaccharide export outer membrane protein [Faunimonas pinastri]|uniref:Polysaccharide export outer membrane protein n=1 Tax=Faunimonas pinastri TaxID=1855383 RepID=A0A1H9FEK7_9HYPH|nr:polysaccharide biosynthesis/export family protein [Faunimonas pinastri]SEQ36319.1 polysaccharide export outer membrane protein [Faunimonas pinastri]
MKLLKFVAVGLMTSAAAGCGLPSSSPTFSQVQRGAVQPAGMNFCSVQLDPRITAILKRPATPGFSSVFRDRAGAPTLALRPGDVVSVTIYEAGGASLFGTAPSADQLPDASSKTSTTLPPQSIEADGRITVPYAGRIIAVGKTPGSLAREIEQQLAGKAVQPQVIVSTVSNGSSIATVGGEVGKAGVVPLTLRGEKLLDVIAEAGGAKYPAYETYVQIIRGRTSGMIQLQRVLDDPGNNIFIRPNDQVFLSRNPSSFTVLGATQKVSQYTFDTEHVSLAEAIGRAGGPIDTIGNPGGIFLFRYEPASVASEVLQAPAANPASCTLAMQSPYVPVMYRIDLSQPSGYFLAQQVPLRDKDVILATDADAVHLQKAISVVRGFTGIAYDLNRNVKD